MEDPTAGVKSTGEIQQDMAQTRESITEKVAALESQVIGTFQNAADTVTNTVDAVKEAVTGTPAAVNETVKQTMDAVKQAFHDTIGSFSVSGCVRKNPWAAMGTTMLAGFLVGYRGSRTATVRAPSQPPAAPPQTLPAREQPHSFVGDLGNVVGNELRQLAEESLKNLVQSLKRSIGAHMPEVVDTAVNRVSEHLQHDARFRASASTNGC